MYLPKLADSIRDGQALERSSGGGASVRNEDVRSWISQIKNFVEKASIIPIPKHARYSLPKLVARL